MKVDRSLLSLKQKSGGAGAIRQKQDFLEVEKTPDVQFYCPATAILCKQ